jgi:thioester reductase-like protein
MRQYTLLTGATGLVGSFLMRDMLARREPLAVLVRNGIQGNEWVQRFLQWCESTRGDSIGRPMLFVGDINRSQLGLDATQRRWIASNCRRVFHSAAALTFVNSRRDQDPWKTNVDGTRALLEFCRQAGIKDFHHVSTAYVCGKRQGLVLEEELAAGQDFRNDYEQSKYLAETVVRQCDWIDPPTIYRPVVVSGDSRTGFSSSFHGLHAYLKLLDSLLKAIPADSSGRKHAPLRIALNGNERRNLVTVDWVSQVICDLSEIPAARGQTFHLAPQVPYTNRQLLDQVFQLFDCHGIRFTGAADNEHAVQGQPVLSKLERAFLNHTCLYRDYERTDPVFDDTNVRRFASHIPCPPIDGALLGRYLRFGRATDWGKRSWPLPVGVDRQQAA